MNNYLNEHSGRGIIFDSLFKKEVGVSILAREEIQILGWFGVNQTNVIQYQSGR